MSSHAKPFPRWLDALFACLSWRVSTGRHTLPAKPEGGATPEFADTVREIRQAAPMRPEVRA